MTVAAAGQRKIDMLPKNILDQIYLMKVNLKNAPNKISFSDDLNLSC